MTRRIWITLGIMVAIAAGGFTLVRQMEQAVSGIVMQKYLTMAMIPSPDLNYVEDVTTTTADGTETARIFHSGGAEKLEYRGGGKDSAWSITRDGRCYTHLPGSRRLLVSDSSSLLKPLDRLRLLESNYDVRVEGGEKIAGRDTQVVTMTSRRGSRLAKKIWMGGSVVLRSEDYTASGQLQSRTETKHITCNAKIDPRTFDLPERLSAQPVCEACSSSKMSTPGFSVVPPGYLPAGYKLDGTHVLHSTCGCGHLSAQFTYTDGLRTISVFETPKMVCCKSCGSDKCDDQNCGIATLGQVTRKDKVVVVVGDLLPAELKKIAESVP